MKRRQRLLVAEVLLEWLGVCSSIIMCSVAVCLRIACVCTVTFDVIARLRSAFNHSSGLSSEF